MTTVYGVKLALYKGQRMDTWVWSDHKRFETSDYDEAIKIADEYAKRNPGGAYFVEKIV